MANPAKTVDQNLLPVQAYFNLDGSFNTFIGQNMPFYATINPIQSGLTITNSTIDSTTIGATTPSTGIFTNITTTTGTISTTPSSNTDIANKFYVDTVAQGLGPKAACQVATTSNITLSGLQTIDGYTTLAGDRVLVKNQTSSQFNGIYIASTTTWTRAVDMDVWAEVPGAYTVILSGGQSDTGWVCTASQTGTINVTAMPWVQFSNVNTYFAGTGLTLASNTFSITNTGITATTYGSASAVPVIAVNAQGQITSATTTTIAINNTQVSGLGTMSTQNANSVTITGGSINGTTIGASTAAAITGTTITANSSFSGPGTGLTGTASGLSIGGNAATATTATTASSVTNSITFNSSGTGGSSPVTYNGSTAPTISYNTIGAPSTSGTNASGTWGISVTGNAATVTNGVYTTGSYSNPSWITSILGSIVSGAVASATTSTNLSGGLAGSLPYQSGAGATTFLGIGSANYVLTSTGSAPQYVAQSTLSVGSASTATTATNLAGGIASQIPYQTAAGTTAFIANGTTGQFLTSNGTSAPSWTTSSASITITDDTSSATAYYPLFARVTTGTTSTEYTSSTKLNYTPSTGLLAATAFSGSGASLTSLTAGNLSGTIPSSVLGNSTVYIGTTAVALNRASASISLTGTSIDGSAGSATTATTATNATNTAITDNTSSSSTWYPTIVSTTTGNLPQTTSSTKLSFVPSTGILSATGITGALNGSLGATTPSTASVTTLTIGTTQLGAGNSSIMKNRIINGAMVVDQRNAGASTTPTSTNTYTLDRWINLIGASSKFSVQQNAGSVTPPLGFTNYYGVTSLSAYSIGSSDYEGVGQKIEGYNIADLGFGTANAKTVTVSFWVRSSLTGTFGGSLLNGAQDRSYPFTYTISASNTWEQKSVTIAGDTSGTWLTTNGTGMFLNFNLGTGTTYSGTAGSWASANYLSATGATSVVGTNGATFYITGVQIEVGSFATGFEYVNYQTSLANCQRYFQTYVNANQVCIPANGVWRSITRADVTQVLPVVMRATPTIATTNIGNINVYSGGSSSAASGFSDNGSSPNIVAINISATGVAGAGVYLQASGASAGYTLSSEL
jgi:hypothetical protein